MHQTPYPSRSGLPHPHGLDIPSAPAGEVLPFLLRFHLNQSERNQSYGSTSAPSGLEPDQAKVKSHNKLELPAAPYGLRLNRSEGWDDDLILNEAFNSTAHSGSSSVQCRWSLEKSRNLSRSFG